jgi:hypothetical protein
MISSTQPLGIDCVRADTCWVVGASNYANPWAVETTDGGATWTTFTNLPAITQYDPNGTYILDSISCTSAQSCVAVGGLNYSDGIAQVISTTDGGTTWSLSSDPVVTKAQSLFSLSCLPGAGGTPLCTAVGFAQQANDAGVYGPIALTSTDGGATWKYVNTFDTTGWMNSVSCADAQHCWAAGAGTAVSLVGTADGWASWSQFTAETTNEEGSVSCASANFCVSTADNAIWFTFTDGGLAS